MIKFIFSQIFLCISKIQDIGKSLFSGPSIYVQKLCKSNHPNERMSRLQRQQNLRSRSNGQSKNKIKY